MFKIKNRVGMVIELTFGFGLGLELGLGLRSAFSIRLLGQSFGLGLVGQSNH